MNGGRGVTKLVGLAAAAALAAVPVRASALGAQDTSRVVADRSVDGLALLASRVIGIQGQVAGLRAKLDGLTASAASAGANDTADRRVSGRSAERCCTGEGAALHSALAGLQADIEKVRKAYGRARHAEGLRRSAPLDGQLRRMGKTLASFAAAGDLSAARAEATHLGAAADALRRTISDIERCCSVRISPDTGQ